MISDSQSNYVYFSDLLRTDDKYKAFCRELIELLDKNEINYGFLENTNDIWCRDYMPIQVSEDTFIEYRYDPDYLLDWPGRKVKTYPDLVCQAIGLKTVKSDLILDGGNVIKGKNKVILTDKIIPENAHKHLKAALIRRLEELFEVDEVILIPWLEKDLFGHADGMIRFLDDDNVIIDGYHKRSKSPQSQKFLAILKKHRLQEHVIEFHVPKQSKHNWGYVNFLQTGEILLLPSFGIDEDEQAFRKFEEWFPVYAGNRKLIQLDASAIIRNGGALNCISWNIRKS